MAIPAIAAQLAVPVAAKMISKLCSANSTAKPPVEQAQVNPSQNIIQQQQMMAKMTGKGININVYA